MGMVLARGCCRVNWNKKSNYAAVDKLRQPLYGRALLA
jgi:hypothetical protein